MSSEVVKKATQAVTVLGLVAVPAFGGQLVSAGAKAKITPLRNAAAKSRIVEFFVDLGGGGVAALPAVGLAMALGTKGAALRALPFALAGVFICGLLPLLDSVVDTWVRALVGDADADADVDAASADAAPGGARSSSTRRSTTLRAIPGGARDNVYKRSKSLRVPGGGMTVEANQATPVPLSMRLRVPPPRR